MNMVIIKKHSGIYTLMVDQALPIPLQEAWEFFSSPKNLERITPKHMNFRITSGEPEPMYPGQIISYKVSPFPGMKTNWVTEITHVEKEKYFVDEQRFGPYKMWHHEHSFEEREGTVWMRDKVSYKLPFGILGDIAQRLFVRKQLKGIFNYRQQVLDELFKK